MVVPFAHEYLAPDLNRFTLFVVSYSGDLVGWALLELKHESDA